MGWTIHRGLRLLQARRFLHLFLDINHGVFPGLQYHDDYPSGTSGKNWCRRLKRLYGFYFTAWCTERDTRDFEDIITFLFSSCALRNIWREGVCLPEEKKTGVLGDQGYTVHRNHCEEDEIYA